MTVHPAASEAAIRHLNQLLAKANLDLAVAVGNLAWKDAVIAGLEAQLAPATMPEPSPSDSRVKQPCPTVARRLAQWRAARKTA